jgi:predicted DNA binding CopG/RHH family protein
MQQLLLMNVEQLLRDFAAYRTFHKSDFVINMRVPHEILDKIKEIAAEQGVPYQSLISSVLFALASSDDSKGAATTTATPAPAVQPQSAVQ